MLQTMEHMVAGSDVMPTTAKTFKEYIQDLVDRTGSDLAVGKYLDFGDGSRVGAWRKGIGRGSELACVKLARWTGDDPIHILRLAGYDEMADLLQGHVAPAMPEFSLLKPQLGALRDMLEIVMKVGGPSGSQGIEATGVGSRDLREGAREAVSEDAATKHRGQGHSPATGRVQGREAGGTEGRHAGRHAGKPRR